MKPVWPAPSATYLRASANGTRSSNRLFAWISQNWRGKPLTSYAVILKLIAATTTQAGLTVQCQLDTNAYPTGRKVSDEEMATLCILPDTFHGEWNYTIRPRTPQSDTLIL